MLRAGSHKRPDYELTLLTKGHEHAPEGPYVSNVNSPSGRSHRIGHATVDALRYSHQRQILPTPLVAVPCPVTVPLSHGTGWQFWGSGTTKQSQRSPREDRLDRRTRQSRSADVVLANKEAAKAVKSVCLLGGTVGEAEAFPA